MSDVYGLRYNEVSFKASHNSYDRDETLVEQLSWSVEEPWNGGCRGLELDINQSDDGNYWSVGHVGGYDDKERQLSQFLSELKVWAEADPEHDVVTLYLDLKEVEDGFEDDIDQYINQYLARPIYRPADLMREASSVPQGALDYGWPTLNELRGKFIIVLSGDSDAKTKYADDDPRVRLCFADKDRDQDEEPESNTRVFFNYDVSERDDDEWGPVFEGQATNPASVCRGYVINEEDFWDDVLGAGCNILATDRVRDNDWAKVSSIAPFVQLKPLATPAPAVSTGPEARAQPA